MAAKTFTIKAGDRFPALATQLLDMDGNPINLELYSTAKIVIAPCVAGRRIVDMKTATMSALRTDGKIAYIWGEGETDKPGEYLLEVVLTTLTGVEQTVPGGWYDKVVILPRL